MVERNYSDEQIREEVNKTLSNPQLRQCSHCIHGADFTTYAKLHIPISKYQYCGFCKHFMTNEEKMIQEASEAGFDTDHSSDCEVYQVGDRIGQIIIMPYPQIEFEEVDELSETERGEGGYGSSGK